MRQLIPVSVNPAPGRAFANRITDWITRAIDAVLNRLFSLTHRASITRWRALLVAFILSWLVAMVAVNQNGEGGRQLGQIFADFLAVIGGKADSQALVASMVKFFFTVALHPAVIRHMLALIAPFWLMHRVTAIYLADIFEEPEVTTAQQFVMEAAFGRGYTTIHIRKGMVAEEDQDSTIIRIGGPGYVQVDLDSAVLFERPDGTPHVIGPTGKEIIDDFERIRRVVDLRDSVDTVDLPPTRSKDGVIVGAKDIQFSYSIYRGENPDRSQIPYPFNPQAVESLVYKDTRVVKPGVAPARMPEWQSGQFKMGGAILGEMGGFISKRGLSEFLAAIGEPEERSLTNREQQIDQNSQLLSGINGNQAGDPPLQAGPFSSRTFLTEIFYNQDDFQDRMAKKGFTLNWIGVGTWHTPTEIIPANHREAWKTSRENFARGNPQAINTLRAESKLQELLRLIQTLPISRFFSDLEKQDDEKLLDDLLQEYEETLQRAADLFLRGQSALDLRFTRLIEQAAALSERIKRPAYFDYDNFLQNLAVMSAGGYYVFEAGVEEFLRQSSELFNTLGNLLESEDKEFLKSAVQLYNDLRVYNQILRVIRAISIVRRSQYRVG